MGFSELIVQLQNPGEDGLPDTIYDDLTTAYNTDIAARDATIEEHNTASENWGIEKADLIATHDSGRQALETEISRLKAMGFDALMSAPGADAGTGEGEGDGDGDGDGGEDETEYTSVDDLFTTKSKDD